MFESNDRGRQTKELLDFGVIEQVEIEQIKLKYLRGMILVEQRFQDIFMDGIEFLSGVTDTFSGVTTL